MEKRILAAISEINVNYASLDERVEMNRQGVNRALGVNAILTGIGSTIAAVFGINN